jgi:hypothetical protein
MKFKKPILLLLLSVTTAAFSQTGTVKVNANIHLPKDSIVSKKLISSLNDFILQKDKPNEQNTSVFKEQSVETFVLLDEIAGMEKRKKDDTEDYFKPYLTNVAPINATDYVVQLAFIGVAENTPTLRASFELVAHKSADGFVFSSPLVRNTASWKKIKIGNCIFHYKSTINNEKAKAYEKYTVSFDKKLKAVNKITEIYCCDDSIELQKLLGIGYKLDFNGRNSTTLSSVSGDKKLIVMGSNSGSFNDFDPHDLWHERLSNVISRRAVNKPIDEACAYIYGGSWGMSWKDIFTKFKTKVASNKEANWVELYEKNENFGESQAEHLLVGYVINALIIQQLEKEKGFPAIWELLNCGKYEKGNENYFRALEKLTGITKQNYNQKVWELIQKEG